MNREHATYLTQSQPTAGVLSEDEVVLVDVVEGKRVLRSLLLPAEARTLRGLLEYLWQVELGEVWVLPATTLSRTSTCASLERAQPHWNVVVHPSPRESTRPCSALFWPREGGERGTRRLVLAFAEHCGWDWEVADARSLLATVTYLDLALGRSFADAPELVAHRVLNELTSGQLPSGIRSSPVDLSRLPGHDGSSILTIEGDREVVWMRPLTLAEQRQKYLHKYCHLSLFLEAAIHVRLGVGEAQYSANGRTYDGRRPGVWRVSAERMGSVFDGRRLPSCLEGEWMSTPQVQCCRDIGYQVQVREGISWPESLDLLKGWATTLWQSGERLYTQPQRFRHAQARANASATITQLVKHGVTILAREQASGGWNRPDWRASLVGASRATLFGHLVRLARKGTMPALVAGDALWVVSNDSNPLTAVPGLVTTRNWQGYHAGYAAPLPLSSDLRDAFRTTDDAARLALMLDTLAGEGFP